MPSYCRTNFGCAYVSFLKAAHNTIGDGQLFFVAAALASECLAVVLRKGGGTPLTVSSLWVILLISVALFAAATVWKLKQPPNQIAANVIVVGGSLGMVVWTINIALDVLGTP